MARAVRTGPPPRRIQQDTRGRYDAPQVQRVNDGLPQASVFPKQSEMLGLNTFERFQLLRAYEVVRPWPEYARDMAQYLTRVTALSPGSPAFNAELNRLLDVSTDRGLLMMARQTQQTFTTVEGLQGDLATEFIRVTDTEIDDKGNASTCDSCEALAGEIGTLAYHQEIGMPGPASCQGGGYCNCQLVPIS